MRRRSADFKPRVAQRALRAAPCVDFIDRLPEGRLTRLGEAGTRLSGGERECLSIARAILKNTPIVILDQSTAALDTESELAVQAAIDALVQDRSVIVIAHRLSPIVAADRIVVFENGAVTQIGTHAKLLRFDGSLSSQEEGASAKNVT